MKRKKTPSGENLKHSKPTRQIPFLCLIALLLPLLVVTGCARQPWNNLVDEQRSAQLISSYDHYRQQISNCGNAIDGDLKLHWQTAIDDVSLSGYFQIMAPSYIRFTVTNPLGQPQLMLAVNPKDYQILNVPRQMFYSGSLRSYAARSDVPQPFLTGPWFVWLSGRLIDKGARIEEIRDDETNRGVWFSLVTDDKKKIPLEYLLLDTKTSLPLERIVVDEQGDVLARIVYDNWQQVDRCLAPMAISVSGMSFWAEANLSFTDVRTASLKPTDFKIPVPSGYMKQFRP